ncbi:30S ribosomal protein S4e [Candidatus Woesearchaeota archaeon]|nr:30S ribosomal protein S4e [Candidatus Woesearchaeota archaeon]
MVKNHLKRIAMPKTWTTADKKGIVWAPKVNPGAHSMNEGLPLVILMRELLKLANTKREVRNILNHKKILIDGKQRKDHKFNVGLMDIISIEETKENFRMSFNKYGKLVPVAIDQKEAKEKICKIKGKGFYEGKSQLRLSDGRIILIEKGNYKTSDSIIITVPEQKIVQHLPFEKGAAIMLTGGKKIGVIGVIEEIKKDVIRIKSHNDVFETDKKHCFVVGKGKPSLTV